MADVRGTGLRARRRGQLFLVGALALSVILVTLAVLLNTAIYTGNVATRDPGPGTTEVIEYENAAAAASGQSMTTVNRRNDSSYAALDANFTASVDAWSEAASIHVATGGGDAYTAVNGTTNGTRIGQDSVGNFTADDGNAAWRVANDSHARAFRMNVSRASLSTYGGTLADLLAVSSDHFQVTFTDADGDEWDVFVYQNSGNTRVGVTVVDPADTEIGNGCSVDPGADGYAVVDVTNASLGGEPCPEMAIFDSMNGSYDVGYNQSTNVKGTYTVVVDRPLSQLDTGADDDPSVEPFARPAIYSAELRVVYRSPVVSYNATSRVAPGEPDA